MLSRDTSLRPPIILYHGFETEIIPNCSKNSEHYDTVRFYFGIFRRLNFIVLINTITSIISGCVREHVHFKQDYFTYIEITPGIKIQIFMHTYINR